MTTTTGYAVPTISDLQAIDSDTRVDGYLRSVTAEKSWFMFLSSSTDTADSVNIIAPSSGGGRWYKLKAMVFASEIINLSETVQDIIGGGFLAGSTVVNVSYDDAGNSLVLSLNSNSITNTQISSSAAIDQSKISGLISALAGKASVNHSHVSSDIVDFNESVDDRVAALLVPGTGITFTYNDAANTLTINSSGGGGGGSITAEDEGSSLGSFDTINFTGSSITATLAGSVLTVEANTPSALTTSTATVSTSSPLAANAQEIIALTGITRATCINVTTDYPARIRAYINSASASADASRSLLLDPTGEHGCLLECVTTDTNLNLDLSPPVEVYGKTSSTIYIALANFSGTPRNLSCTLTFIKW